MGFLGKQLKKKLRSVKLFVLIVIE